MNYKYYLRLSKYLLQRLLSKDTKYLAEGYYWQEQLLKIIDWYQGKIPSIWTIECPSKEQKIKHQDIKTAALLTWLKLHQTKKYLSDLQLKNNAFVNLEVLDIGSGPYPSGLAFNKCSLICLDPLLDRYRQSGYLFNIYPTRCKFIQAKSEKIPLPNHSVDAVISVNALDHVDNLQQTSIEIRRVLKPKGKIRFHVHYHPSTTTEPLEIDDTVMKTSFSWIKNLTRISKTKTKMDSRLSSPNEYYTLWSNF